jgi:diguanylate cyclase (GGDEF)-like protein
MRNQLASVVLSDPLSGCFNRRGFEQQYRRELKRAARAHVEVALLAIDLDDFKAINETHGHAAGDRIIAEAGELLRASARAEDVVARTGGDEFTILAPNTTLEGAQYLAERVLLAFRKRGFVDARQPLSATVSVGLVAESVRDDSIAESLRARADEALQAAKRAGRNQLAVA